jgi:hypothetical protein
MIIKVLGFLFLLFSQHLVDNSGILLPDGNSGANWASDSGANRAKISLRLIS